MAGGLGQDREEAQPDFVNILQFVHYCPKADPTASPGYLQFGSSTYLSPQLVGRVTQAAVHEDKTGAGPFSS
jgi:hypothetical protein